MAWMFINQDIVFQELFRSQLIRGLRDGATVCAHLLQTLVCAPTNDDNVRALLNIDLRNAFNEVNRHASFDARTGKASHAYDSGRVQIGDDLPHLASAQHFFLYFKAMHNGASSPKFGIKIKFETHTTVDPKWPGSISNLAGRTHFSGARRIPAAWPRRLCEDWS
jgi:hypothetical protein